MSGFPQISGVFFSIFHPELGSKPCSQVPDGVIKATPTSEVPRPLVNFNEIKNYIIPKPSLCNRLVAVLYQGYYVIGFPVNIPSKSYPRNSFTFNLAFIFRADVDSTPYESVIARTAKMLRALEEQSFYLSTESNMDSLDSAIEQMYQDLNSFSECMISIDATNKIDIKLLPILEAPTELHSWDVPLTTVKLESMVDETWDPTLERLLPYINGVNSVRQIADLASADYNLTKKGVQHLVHYGCAVITSIFQFSNIYAPTSSVSDITYPQTYQEFCDYVHKSQPYKPQLYKPPFARSRRASQPSEVLLDPGYVLTVKQAFKLYSSFSWGVPLSSWYHSNRDLLQEIDLNRFITFGVLKRLIYVVHAFPLWVPRRHPPNLWKIEETLESCGLAPEHAPLLQKALEVPTHFDELCTELRANRVLVSKVLMELGDWSIVNS